MVLSRKFVDIMKYSLPQLQEGSSKNPESQHHTTQHLSTLIKNVQQTALYIKHRGRRPQQLVNVSST